jgi:hypothetical protein
MRVSLVAFQSGRFTDWFSTIFQQTKKICYPNWQSDINILLKAIDVLDLWNAKLQFNLVYKEGLIALADLLFQSEELEDEGLNSNLPYAP